MLNVKDEIFLENMFLDLHVCVHTKLRNLKNKFQRGGFMCRLGRRENSKACTKKLMGIIQQWGSPKLFLVSFSFEHKMMYSLFKL
jgi:hypothetical protein